MDYKWQYYILYAPLRSFYKKHGLFWTVAMVNDLGHLSLEQSV